MDWYRRTIAGWQPLQRRWWLWLALGLSGGIAITLWVAPLLEQQPSSQSSSNEAVRIDVINLGAAVGAFYPVGIVSKVTPFTRISNESLKARVIALADKMRLLEIGFDARRDAAAKSPKEDSSFQEIQAQITQIETEKTQKFHDDFLAETRSLIDEMLTRLKLPYPSTTLDGISVDGYRVFAIGIASGHSPITDLANYLELTAKRL